MFDVRHSSVVGGGSHIFDMRHSYNNVTRGGVHTLGVNHSVNKVLAFPVTCPEVKSSKVKSSTSLTNRDKSELKDLKAVDVEIFHKRMNHQGMKGLRKVAKSLGYRLVGKLDNCIECAQGRARKNPFYKKKNFLRYGKAQCWYLDCQGPSRH